MKCSNCSHDIPADSTFCPMCGHAMTPATEASMREPASSAPARKNRVAAGVLGILLGGLGIHKFYLGYTWQGVIMLVVWIVGVIVTFGIASVVVGIIGLIEGILYLVKSDEEFDRIYVQAKKGWF